MLWAPSCTGIILSQPATSPGASNTIRSFCAGICDRFVLTSSSCMLLIESFNWLVHSAIRIVRQLSSEPSQPSVWVYSARPSPVPCAKLESLRLDMKWPKQLVLNLSKMDWWGEVQAWLHSRLSSQPCRTVGYEEVPPPYQFYPVKFFILCGERKWPIWGHFLSVIYKSPLYCTFS